MGTVHPHPIPLWTALNGNGTRPRASVSERDSRPSPVGQPHVTAFRDKRSGHSQGTTGGSSSSSAIIVIARSHRRCRCCTCTTRSGTCRPRIRAGAGPWHSAAWGCRVRCARSQARAVRRQEGCTACWRTVSFGSKQIFGFAFTKTDLSRLAMVLAILLTLLEACSAVKTTSADSAAAGGSSLAARGSGNRAPAGYVDYYENPNKSTAIDNSRL